MIIDLDAHQGNGPEVCLKVTGTKERGDEEREGEGWGEEEEDLGREWERRW
jgi:hypothetical protein